MIRTPIFTNDRVAFQAHSDLFMRGERFGTVAKCGTKYLHIKGERSGRTFRVPIASDTVETLAPPVTMNETQRLYVIRNSYGYSCFGFDNTDAGAAKYLAWLEHDGATDAADLAASYAATANPSLERYAAYRAIMAAVYARVTPGRRCDADLVPQLIGLEGKRVEVVDAYGERRRFKVGKSTGWLPIHLEIANSASHGGGAVYGAPFKSVRVL